MNDDEKKERLEFRARQAADGKKAMAEYEAAAIATRAKTERLRAARLAQEAAAPPPPPKRAAKSAAKGAAGTKTATKRKAAPKGKLSDWLDQEANSGRKT